MNSSKDLLNKENDSEYKDGLNEGKRLDNDKIIFFGNSLHLLIHTNRYYNRYNYCYSLEQRTR